MVGKSDSPRRDAAIARFASRQHGLVTAAQLQEAGLSSAAISKRVEAARLHRLHRGVYSVGYAAESQEARWMAAVLACGHSAALSHRSAAALWELLRPMEGPIEVSVRTQNGRRARRGIRLHRRAALSSQAVTIRNLIPVTTPGQTIEDLRGVVSPALQRRALRQAEIGRFALGPGAQGDRTRSDLERIFLSLCRRSLIPAPLVNVRVGRWTVDFLWPEQRLVVEADSWRFHGGSVAFEDDHARDVDLRRRGYAVHRFSERQIRHEEAVVAADVAAALQATRRAHG
jgi:very-short-patch-repair endonuclease